MPEYTHLILEIPPKGAKTNQLNSVYSENSGQQTEFKLLRKRSSGYVLLTIPEYGPARVDSRQSQNILGDRARFSQVPEVTESRQMQGPKHSSRNRAAFGNRAMAVFYVSVGYKRVD
jgi:hypothetical protein